MQIRVNVWICGGRPADGRRRRLRSGQRADPQLHRLRDVVIIRVVARHRQGRGLREFAFPRQRRGQFKRNRARIRRQRQRNIARRLRRQNNRAARRRRVQPCAMNCALPICRRDNCGRRPMRLRKFIIRARMRRQYFHSRPQQNRSQKIRMRHSDCGGGNSRRKRIAGKIQSQRAGGRIGAQGNCGKRQRVNSVHSQQRKAPARLITGGRIRRMRKRLVKKRRQGFLLRVRHRINNGGHRQRARVAQVRRIFTPHIRRNRRHNRRRPNRRGLRNAESPRRLVIGKASGRKVIPLILQLIARINRKRNARTIIPLRRRGHNHARRNRVVQVNHPRRGQGKSQPRSSNKARIVPTCRQNCDGVISRLGRRLRDGHRAASRNIQIWRSVRPAVLRKNRARIIRVVLRRR